MTRETFLQRMRAYTERTEAALTGYLAMEGIPPLLRESMAYSLFAGGKRLRPAMALAACEMCLGDCAPALPVACALEMIHTYSLIHDDLPAMDDDALRRGKPTSHMVYGEGHAILAGDGLLSLAMQILLAYCAQEPDKPQLLQAALAVARGAGVCGMVAGQSLDLKAEAEQARDAKTLLAIHKGKTAAMLVAAVEAGGLCAGADAPALDALKRFGAQYGLLFQITDDILDVEGDAARMGKTLGKDEQSGKLTYPSVFGLAGARNRAQAAMEAARAALSPFGEDAAFFHALLDYTIARQA